jgi:hypothetical protein
VKSSTSAALAAAALLALTLGLKVLVSAVGSRSAAPVPRAEELHRFLTVATAQPVEAVPGGWRFQNGTCRMLAFPSGPRGTLDLAARNYAHRQDRVAYVYRGQVRATPPAFGLAIDVIAYTLSRPFRAANEPGYIVLIAPKACAAIPNLPWGRLPVA